MARLGCGGARDDRQDRNGLAGVFHAIRKTRRTAQDRGRQARAGRIFSDRAELRHLGVVAAGFIVAISHSTLADPIVSLLIAVLIYWSSFGVIRESATVLLEGTPPGLDMHGLIAAIRAVAGVRDVHDLHVWMVGPGVIASSCHIVVAEQTVRQGQQVVRAVARGMESQFDITHTTVQVEVEGCEPNDLYCVRPPPFRKARDARYR